MPEKRSPFYRATRAYCPFPSGKFHKNGRYDGITGYRYNEIPTLYYRSLYRYYEKPLKTIIRDNSQAKDEKKERNSDASFVCRPFFLILYADK